MVRMAKGADLLAGLKTGHYTTQERIASPTGLEAHMRGTNLP